MRVPGTTVTVKPVLDLTEHLHVDQYQVPDRLADQAAERDLTCVFPWCTRPAEHCDTDHVIPYSEGGPTASDNLAPLCRRHHRLKTHHGGWGYTVLEPGSYLWSSPHGYQVLRDHRGTTDVTRDQTTHPPDSGIHRPVPRAGTPRAGPPACPGVKGGRSATDRLPHPRLRARESTVAGRHQMTFLRRALGWAGWCARRRKVIGGHPGASPRAPDA